MEPRGNEIMEETMTGRPGAKSLASNAGTAEVWGKPTGNGRVPHRLFYRPPCDRIALKGYDERRRHRAVVLAIHAASPWLDEGAVLCRLSDRSNQTKMATDASMATKPTVQRKGDT